MASALHTGSWARTADDELRVAHEALERRSAPSTARAAAAAARRLSRSTRARVGGSAWSESERAAVEARAVEGDVGASGEAHVDDVGARARRRGGSRAGGRPRPARRRCVSSSACGQHAVEQPRGQVGLLAQREVGVDRPVACDDGGFGLVVRVGVRMPGAVPLPRGPHVLTVRRARLHLAQAEARVGGILERAVEAAAVRLDPVDLHHPPRTVHEDLAPHAALVGLLAHQVGDLCVVGERLLRHEDLERLGGR